VLGCIAVVLAGARRLPARPGRDLVMTAACPPACPAALPWVQMALAMLKRSVKKRAGFSVDRVAPLDCVGSSFIPALFGGCRGICARHAVLCCD
jgi:hypothetical protein